MCTYPYMSKTSQVVWTILQIASKDSEFDKVLWTCKESAEDPASNFRLWISKDPPVLWIWHRVLHCAYSQRNPKKLLRKGRGYWPAEADRGTAGEGWQHNNKCGSHHRLGPNNRLCGDHVVDPQHHLYSYLYSTAANRPTIDHGSLEIWSNSEPSLCFFFFFLTELRNSTTGKAATAALSLVRFGWLPESTTHVCSGASLEEDASGNE